MAPGMQAFVQGRNPQLARTQTNNNNSERVNNDKYSLEDQKVEVPKFYFTTKGSRPPSRGLERSRSPPQMRKVEDLKVQRFPGETEDDVFTVTSLATEEHDDKAAVTLPEENGEVVSFRDDDDDDDIDDVEQIRFPNGDDGYDYRHGRLQFGSSPKLNARQHEFMQMMDPSRQRQFDEHSLLQQDQEGDSYPESASDTVSVPDVQQSRTEQWKPLSNNDSSVQRYDLLQARLRQLSGSAGEPVVDKPKHQHATSWSTTKANGTAAHDGLANGFQFAQAPRRMRSNGAASPPIESRQRNGNGDLPQNAALNGRTQANTTDSGKPHNRRQHIVPMQEDLDDSRQRPRSKGEQNPRARKRPHSGQRQPPQENHSKETQVNVDRTRETRLEHVDDDETEQIQLDVEPTRLFTMDYSELKTQPFDHDPHTVPFNAKGIKANDSLDVKVQAVGSMATTEQERFLESLTLDEWQEAGDWFVTRFSELIRQMKQVRQSRRQEAHAFEDEVEQRQEAVQRKRAQTDAVLEKMRANGSLVLQGTPRKGGCLEA